MSAIFGQISANKINKENLDILIKHSEQSGKDSSGIIYLKNNRYEIFLAEWCAKKLFQKIKPFDSKIIIAHSSIILTKQDDIQPICNETMCLFYSGLIVNENELYSKLKITHQSNIIISIVQKYLQNNEISEIPNAILSLCKGQMSSILLLPKLGKMLLFSNTGSLYTGYINDDMYFSTEKYPLSQIKCKNISQIKHEAMFLDIPISSEIFLPPQEKKAVQTYTFSHHEEKLLEAKEPSLKRCTRCILPETMPFIKFDNAGVCNYCHNYKSRNNPKPKEELFKLVESYRKPKDELDCIIPFSGGRDSCYGLHLVVKELQMKPITYTYDWGMVADVGRRNASKMCGDLGIENIVVAADISKKIKNIKMNLQAWLRSPHLGMMAMLTAGDKHFFRYIEHIKKQTGINLNLWGVNPLEVTYFKTGFLELPPDFEEKKVYSHGIIKQLKYHSKRFKAMCQNPSYFNSSLWDTLSGEYYRSFTEKKDYYHIFDYWQWDETLVNNTLINDYGWELATDTSSTWRIGDATAAFYNYVYYTVAGFSEHDTFRSNQIRENQLTRAQALKLVQNENQPRYQNIKIYLDILGMDFEEVIKVVNSIPKLYIV